MRSMRTVAPLLITVLAVGCGASKTVELTELDGSGTRGSVLVHEAVTKSFTTRVDVFVEVEQPTAEMIAGLVEGTCAAPGPVLQVLQVHRSGEGGAAEVVLAEGRLSDLAGQSIHVFAGPPEASMRLACGDL